MYLDSVERTRLFLMEVPAADNRHPTFFSASAVKTATGAPNELLDSIEGSLVVVMFSMLVWKLIYQVTLPALCASIEASPKWVVSRPAQKLFLYDIGFSRTMENPDIVAIDMCAWFRLAALAHGIPGILGLPLVVVASLGCNLSTSFFNIFLLSTLFFVGWGSFNALDLSLRRISPSAYPGGLTGCRVPCPLLLWVVAVVYFLFWFILVLPVKSSLLALPAYTQLFCSFTLGVGVELSARSVARVSQIGEVCQSTPSLSGGDGKHARNTAGNEITNIRSK